MKTVTLEGKLERIFINFEFASSYEKMILVIDDLWIAPCSEISQYYFIISLTLAICWNVYIFCCISEGECIRTAAGTDYQGSQAVTQSGETCLPWMIEQVQLFTHADKDQVIGEFFKENYCRNYRFHNALNKPWCFTSSGSWDICHIEYCCKSAFHLE